MNHLINKMYSLLYNILKEKSSGINIFLSVLAYFYVFHSKNAEIYALFARNELKNCILSYISYYFPLKARAFSEKLKEKQNGDFHRYMRRYYNT